MACTTSPGVFYESGNSNSSSHLCSNVYQQGHLAPQARRNIWKLAPNLLQKTINHAPWSLPRSPNSPLPRGLLEPVPLQNRGKTHLNRTRLVSGSDQMAQLNYLLKASMRMFPTTSCWFNQEQIRGQWSPPPCERPHRQGSVCWQS